MSQTTIAKPNRSNYLLKFCSHINGSKDRKPRKELIKEHQLRARGDNEYSVHKHNTAAILVRSGFAVSTASLPISHLKWQEQRPNYLLYPRFFHNLFLIKNQKDQNVTRSNLIR